MQLKSLIFGHDPTQALRIKRLLYASFSYLVGILFVSYAAWQGLASELDTGALVLGAVAINAVFYAVIRSGLNQGLRDPGLTIPQMTVGTLIVTWLLHVAHDARGAFVMGYILVLLFGIFRLRARPTLLIGAIAVLSYAGVIVHEAMEGKGPDHLAADILQLMVLAFIYPFFAQLGSHLNETRSGLRQANEKLEKTLADYQQALKQIQLQATHDDLTGAYNRRHMISTMEAEGERVQRGGLPFSILVLDIDHFKQINDRYGHPGGDRVLVEFAEIVQKLLRGVDHFGRYGGEEFLIVLPQTGLQHACTVAERIRAAVAEAVFPGIDQAITVSVGVACARTGEAHDAVFTRADRALYRAKAKGRNRVETQEAEEAGAAERYSR